MLQLTEPIQSNSFLGYYKYFVDTISIVPDKSEEVLPGVYWGECGALFTPAYWKFQYNLYESGLYNNINYQLGETFLEEVVACLLGGYGIPAEIGLMAFLRLKQLKLITPKASLDDIKEALSTPFLVSKEKTVKYRFANQKSSYIYSFLNRHDLDNIPLNNDISLRKWLLKLDGIGFKTASWITRNWLNSNQVAILDIHIIRAGILAGFYDSEADVSKDYLILERKYLDFCSAMEVDPSKMDAIIWDVMKKNNKLALRYITTIND